MTEPHVAKTSAASPARNAAARLAAVQALYQLELVPQKPERVVADFIAGTMPHEEGETPPPEFDHTLFAHIVMTASKRMAAIDALLAGVLDPRWSLARITRILHALLRAGVAELLPDSGALLPVDTPIIINDYVNIAHGFFAGKEPGMANALLDKIAKKVRQ